MGGDRVPEEIIIELKSLDIGRKDVGESKQINFINESPRADLFRNKT
jgi:hypothetical protein